MLFMVFLSDKTLRSRPAAVTEDAALDTCVSKNSSVDILPRDAGHIIVGTGTPSVLWLPGEWT